MAGVRRFNVLCFTWKEKEDVTLTRLDFNRQILQRLLEVKPMELNCLIRRPGIAASFDVSFVSTGAMGKCLELFNKKKKDAPLNQFLVEPLSDREIKVVTIQFYDETVNDNDIETWLSRHCQVKSASRKVRDADGVWNGVRQWLIQLHEDPNGINGVRHLPSNIKLGSARGFVIYYGMPKLCRNCGELGHIAVACKTVKCKNCGGPHISSMCTEEKKCNLCGKEGHVFKACPDLYSNMVKGLRVLEQTVEEKEADSESQRNSMAQIGNTEESLEEYFSESDSSAEELEYEEESAIADREVRRTTKRKPDQQDEGSDTTKKKVGEVLVSYEAKSEINSGDTSEVEVMEEAGVYADSPAYSSGREDVVRLDFDGAAFLEEGDITSFSTVTAILKPGKGKATAEEGQV
ncbi:UNVERIFIED_CONTAM: hypothetical protein FKN15_078446 [Acipenser sinensis]